MLARNVLGVMLSGAAMRPSKGSASEAGNLEVRFARAPVDRLFVGCVVTLSLVYGGWLLALRLWPGEPEADARQSFHGFVTGSSQPPAGAGELSPAEAGEFGSSKLGTSHYFGGAAPRPIAEGARVVGSAELPEPEREPSQPQPVLASLPSGAGAGAGVGGGADGRAKDPSEDAPSLGRLNLGPRLANWITAGVEPVIDAIRREAEPPPEPPAKN